MIIGLGHEARVGKDTIGEILVEEHGFKRLAFADSLKELALAVNPIATYGGTRLETLVLHHGWEEAKKDHSEPRIFLQRLGKAVRDVLGEGAWLPPVADEIAGDPGADWVITDVRFPNEAQWLAVWGGSIIKVVRPGIVPVNEHVSETALADWPFDGFIYNNGTLDDLAQKVDLLVAELKISGQVT